jgi:hypothetical protein
MSGQIYNWDFALLSILVSVKFFFDSIQQKDPPVCPRLLFLNQKGFAKWGWEVQIWDSTHKTKLGAEHVVIVVLHLSCQETHYLHFSGEQGCAMISVV